MQLQHLQYKQAKCFFQYFAHSHFPFQSVFDDGLLRQLRQQSGEKALIILGVHVLRPAVELPVLADVELVGAEARRAVPVDPNDATGTFLMLGNPDLVDIEVPVGILLHPVARLLPSLCFRYRQGGYFFAKIHFHLLSHTS